MVILIVIVKKMTLKEELSFQKSGEKWGSEVILVELEDRMEIFHGRSQTSPSSLI
ncbi:hypothetical protein [Thermococcus sp. 101 C5]|uniref:hypothetical protein n=1 Tax=Thermococcus sp. 101 C5 TaxID=2654197 RepID=UPI0020A68E82|nr:hypothetical protein [Thermococcus sp. 101 C5]